MSGTATLTCQDKPTTVASSNGRAGNPAIATAGNPATALLSEAPAVSAPTSDPCTFAAWAADEKERRSHHYHSRALVIEDIRTASAELRTRGYMCDRITHTEVMTSEGTKYLGGLMSGDYKMRWVATPSDWYVRLPGKRAGPHYQRIQNLMVKARAMRMSIVLMGPLVISGSWATYEMLLKT